MKKLILLFLAFCAISCDDVKYEKPFIITGESADYRGADMYIYYYQYQDKNSRFKEFSTNKDLWNVGDVIK